MLTPRQSAVLAFLRRELGAGRHPSYRDVAGHFGMYPNAAAGHLRRLRRAGFVDWEPTRSRSLRLCRKVEVIGRTRRDGSFSLRLLERPVEVVWT